MINLFFDSIFSFIGFKYIFSQFMMFTGAVKFFDEAKSFGFLVDHDSQSEVSVHATGLIDKFAQN